MVERGKTPTVQGQLYNGQTDEPLVGYEVRVFSVLHDREQDYLGRGQSGSDGRFTLVYRRTKLARDLVAALAEDGPALLLRVYDQAGNLVYITEERSGDDRFVPWDVAVVGLNPDADALWLNTAFATEIERFLKQPDVLRRIARLLAEEGQATPEQIYAALLESDPFGIDPFTFRTTICCILNRLLDEFKQTALGQQLAVGGSTYKHLGSVFRVFRVVEVIGFIQGPERDGALIEDGVEGREEVDEDFNFKITPTTPLITEVVDAVERTGRIPAGELRDFRFNTLFNPASEYFQRIQCEITPCEQRGELRRFMSQIRALARQARTNRLSGRLITPIEVAVQGEVTFDGTHAGFPGHIEIHPVRDARVL